MDTLEQITSILHINYYVLKNDELQCLCINPEHDDEHLGNFSINIKTGQYNCFACQFHGNVINLLYKQGTSYTIALRLWKNFQSERREEIILPARALDKYSVQPYLDKISSYAEKRVGNREILNLYGVYADEKDNPIFTTRNYKKEYTSIWVREHGRYLLLEPLNAKRSGVFFGENLKATDFTILVEGPFDAMFVYSVLGQKAISGFGTRLSEYQIERLKKMHNLVLMMDGDWAGRNARKYLVNRLSEKSDFYLAGGYTCDPDELSPERLTGVFNNIKNVAGYKIQYDNK